MIGEEEPVCLHLDIFWTRGDVPRSREAFGGSRSRQPLAPPEPYLPPQGSLQGVGDVGRCGTQSHSGNAG